jgi:lipoprotein-releasing system permease protein
VRLPVRLAWRYALSSKSRNLTHLISAISMFVIAAVTAAMIAILSAFNGIESVVTELFGTLDSPVALVPVTGTTLSDEVGEWALAQWGPESEDPIIMAVAPVIEEEAVVAFGTGAPIVVTMLAFDSLLLQGAPIERALQSKKWNPELQGIPCVALGIGVRNMLGIGRINEGPEHALIRFKAPIRGKKLSKHRERAFQSREGLGCDAFSINADLDSRYVLAPLALARDLFGLDHAVSRFELALLPGLSVDEVAKQMRQSIASAPQAIRIRTRSEKNKLITQTNRAEKWATFVILSFILIVAAFNVMASLTMLLLDKREDMSVLHAMGLSGWRLEQVFSLQGLLINTVGGAIGALGGVMLVMGQQTFGWVQLQGSVIPAYPVQLEWTDIVGTLAIVILIGGIGSGWMVRRLVRRLLN